MKLKHLGWLVPCLLLSQYRLFGQVPLLLGSFKHIQLAKVHRDECNPDTILYVRCADDRQALPPKGSYNIFWGDSMQVLQYAETIVALGDTFLASSEAPTRFHIRTTQMGAGQQLALVEGHCDRSFVFTLRSDTLRTSHLNIGTLPIMFAPQSTRPIDTLGLHVLLHELDCIWQKWQHPTWTVWVDDPESESTSLRAKRRCAQRLALLQAYLRTGLGDSYQHVRFAGRKSCLPKAERFTVSYQF